MAFIPNLENFGFIALAFAFAVLQLRHTPSALIITGGVLVIIALRLWHTNVWDSPYDISDHLHAIQYIAVHWARPEMDANNLYTSEFHQAPLYYYLGAALYKLSGLAGDPAFFPVLCFSFFCFSLYLAYAVKLAVLLLQNRVIRTLAVVAIACWPANLFQGARISNDIPLYAAMMACVYYTVCWHRTGYHRAFFKTLIALALGFLVKSSAILLIGVVGAALLLTLRKHHDAARITGYTTQRRTLIFLVLLVAVSASFNFARMAYYIHVTGDDKVSLLLGKRGVQPDNGHPSSDFTIPITAKSFMSFDYDRFVRDPFWGDHSNRNAEHQYFWNEYLKSSLYTMKSWRAPQLASYVNVLFLAASLNFFAMLFYGFVIRLKPTADDGALLMAIYLCFLIPLMAMQMRYPDPGWADERHIYPAAALFIVAYLLVAENYRSLSLKLYSWNISLMAVFTAAACLFSAMQL